MHNLHDWLNYLETLHPKAIDLGLERVGQVAQQLNLLPFGSLVITVAGTNGKGSCVALTAEILRAAGYCVGTYTSPHLLRYNERICINGEIVSDASICAAFAEIEKVRGEVTLSYFEFGTLAALLLFKRANLDVVVLEVGMGARLDAVNIIDADIAVISTIALDHMEWLGSDREAIGFEKAGIMRAGKPCVCGDFDVPRSIRQQAETLQTVLYCQKEDFGYVRNQTDWSWWSKQQQLEHLPLPKVDLQNAATVLKVIELVIERAKLSVPTSAIKTGLKQAYLPGRFQVIPGAVTTILDVAHNPASAELLAKNLSAISCEGRTYAVIAMLNDKDMAETVKFLLQQIDQWYVGGLAVARGGSAKQLADVLRVSQAAAVTEHASVTAAYQQALSDAQPRDQIIVFGSFYTVAEVMQLRI